jgi:hypothetical protein
MQCAYRNTVFKLHKIVIMPPIWHRVLTVPTTRGTPFLKDAFSLSGTLRVPWNLHLCVMTYVLGNRSSQKSTPLNFHMPCHWFSSRFYLHTSLASILHECCCNYHVITNIAVIIMSSQTLLLLSCHHKCCCNYHVITNAAGIIMSSQTLLYLSCHHKHCFNYHVITKLL